MSDSLSHLHICLLAGPPVSAHMWQAFADRLRSQGMSVSTLELFDPAPEDASIAGLAHTVIHAVAAEQATGKKVILAAHGTAVPIALGATAMGGIQGLALMNGPIVELDPILRTACRLARHPRLFSCTVLLPGPLQHWLASSIGLRRAVVNPYVMDRDTVVALSGPILKTSAHRRAVAMFLGDLGEWQPNLQDVQTPTLLIWGHEDRLYPPSNADIAASTFSDGTHHRVAGGRLFHPLEQPWAGADALVDWAAKKVTVT